MHSIEVLRNNYQNICERVKIAAINANRNPNDIKILAVSKTYNYEVIANAVKAGISTFAENYAQEFSDKYKELNEKIILDSQYEFHFIGHLQTNKARHVVPNVTTIHTIDSLHLALEINRQAEKLNKKINVLVQVNTSGEDSKSGILPDVCANFVTSLLPLSRVNVVGLMTIGTFSDNETTIRKEFSLLRNCLQETNQRNGINLTELSMGMSHDFEIAIQEQSTMIRIGSAIFGNRIKIKPL